MTSDGRQVVDFFNLVETKGCPLDFTLTALSSYNLVPDWISFWEHSIEKNWKSSSTRLRLEAAITEVYGVEYLEEWRIRMGHYLCLVPHPRE